MRVIAIDWSGARTGAAGKIWLAEVQDGRLLRLESGRGRDQVAEHLIAEADRDPELVVGLDFAFAFPAWFQEELGARTRIPERGTSEEDVLAAIRRGVAEPAQRGLVQYRLNLEYRRLWRGRFYAVQQVAPIVAEEEDRRVVVTVYTFYFQEGEKP